MSRVCFVAEHDANIIYLTNAVRTKSRTCEGPPRLDSPLYAATQALDLAAVSLTEQVGPTGDA